MRGLRVIRGWRGGGVTLAKLLAALSSGLLLAFCFPPMEWHGAAWFALVPLLIVARFSLPFDAFRYGLLTGFLFWALSLAWLLRLAYTGAPMPLAFAGWFLLALYCAFYVAAFAMVVSTLWKRDGGGSDGRVFHGAAMILVVPLLWVGFEYLRSNLFTGFPWNALGVSQYANLPVCQLAEWGGVYAVSALIVLVNTGAAMTIFRYRGASVGGRYRAHPELMISLLLLALCLAYGMRCVMLFRRLASPRTIGIAAVQPNIPQVKKWPAEWSAMIYDKLINLTEMAAASAPDLIVWPETAVPSCALWDTECLQVIGLLLTNGVPILVGSMDVGTEDGREEYFNSSILFEPGVAELRKYSKQHLCPFGEYVPLARVAPLLEKLAPLGWSCTPGRANTVFRLARRPDAPFSVLICFEDTIASLARKAVLDGARLLINQTNDAWFDVSAGPRQHMIHCVFRCIENRVSAVRATNTGITCFIDPSGTITEILEPPPGSPLTEGFLASRVAVPGADMPLTFYTRHGDVVALPCGIIAALCFVLVAAGEARVRSKYKSRR